MGVAGMVEAGKEAVTLQVFTSLSRQLHIRNCEDTHTVKYGVVSATPGLLSPSVI